MRPKRRLVVCPVARHARVFVSPSLAVRGFRARRQRTEERGRKCQHAVGLAEAPQPEPLEPDDAADPEQAPVRHPRQGRRGPEGLCACGLERDELREEEDRRGEGEEGDAGDAEGEGGGVEEVVRGEAAEETAEGVEEGEEGDEAGLEDGGRRRGRCQEAVATLRQRERAHNRP